MVEADENDIVVLEEEPIEQFAEVLVVEELL